MPIISHIPPDVTSISPDDMNNVLPNKANFGEKDLFYKHDIFEHDDGQ